MSEPSAQEPNVNVAVPRAWATKDDLRRPRGWGILAAVVFGALCVIGAAVDTTQFLRSYLMAYVFWISIALGCLGLQMLGHVAQGGWTVVLRRTFEAGSRTILPMAALFVPVLLGVYRLYPWAPHGAPGHAGALESHGGDKSAYLNVPFFVARSVAYFALWAGSAHVLSSMTLAQDRTGDPALPRRLRRLAALGLLVYGLTVTFAAIDWMMSLDPHWWSTIYGVYFIGGQALAAMSFAIITAYFLSERPGPGPSLIGVRHFHDFGKMLLAFVMLWAYFAFSQFLILWSGNLPEEIPYYIDRSRGGFRWVSFVLIVVGFALPFVLLLSRDLKRSPGRLAMVAALLLLVRWLDVYWLIAPAWSHEYLRVHWLDVAAMGAVGGVWMVLFTRELGKRPLVPVGEPMLSEALSHG
jgi:hypothetical protein